MMQYKLFYELPGYYSPHHFVMDDLLDYIYRYNMFAYQKYLIAVWHPSTTA